MFLGRVTLELLCWRKEKNDTVAVKIRRTDSPRDGMRNEGKLLKIANDAGVGPKLIDSSKNFMVMEYLDGSRIIDWIKELEGKGSAAKIKKIARKILEDCYKLDKTGLDHGELSSITKHVIIGKKITVIDFESSSTERRVSNVTSATQGLYIGSGISKIITKIYKVPPKQKIIKLLQIYKKEQTRKSFDDLLAILRL